MEGRVVVTLLAIISAASARVCAPRIVKVISVPSQSCEFNDCCQTFCEPNYQDCCESSKCEDCCQNSCNDYCDDCYNDGCNDCCNGCCNDCSEKCTTRDSCSEHASDKLDCCSRTEACDARRCSKTCGSNCDNNCCDDDCCCTPTTKSSSGCFDGNDVCEVNKCVTDGACCRDYEDCCVPPKWQDRCYPEYPGCNRACPILENCCNDCYDGSYDYGQQFDPSSRMDPYYRGNFYPPNFVCPPRCFFVPSLNNRRCFMFDRRGCCNCL